MENKLSLREQKVLAYRVLHNLRDTARYFRTTEEDIEEILGEADKKMPCE